MTSSDQSYVDFNSLLEKIPETGNEDYEIIKLTNKELMELFDERQIKYYAKEPLDNLKSQNIIECNFFSEDNQLKNSNNNFFKG